MSLKSVSFPSGGSALNTIFTDDRYGSALGSSLIDSVPVLAAFSRPLDYCLDFDDLTNFNAGNNEAWTRASGITTTVIGTAPGGVLEITSPTGANNEGGIQRLVSYRNHAIHDIYFAVRFYKTASATSGGFVVGMTVADTSPAATPDTGAYFIKADGSASVSAATAAGGSVTTTSSIATIVADTNIELGFILNLSSARFFVNGVLVATHTTNIPSSGALLRTNLVPRTSAGGSTSTIAVDYHCSLQARSL